MAEAFSLPRSLPNPTEQDRSPSSSIPKKPARQFDCVLLRSFPIAPSLRVCYRRLRPRFSLFVLRRRPHGPDGAQMNEQVTRQILWNIPVPFIVLMYGLLGLLIAGFIYAGVRWYRLVNLGVSDDRLDHPIE